MMRLSRGGTGLWAWLYRTGFLRAPMPFWRVVVEARLLGGARRWPRRAESAVTGVFVWARTIEEAEALAVLALEREGLAALTADAKKASPAAAPRRQPSAVARTDLAFLTRPSSGAAARGASRRDARA
jgi:hypothetical protein